MAERICPDSRLPESFSFTGRKARVPLSCPHLAKLQVPNSSNEVVRPDAYYRPLLSRLSEPKTSHQALPLAD